jgi:acetyl esterase/lipase
MVRTVLESFLLTALPRPESGSFKRTFILLGFIFLFLLVCQNPGWATEPEEPEEYDYAIGIDHDITYGKGYCLNAHQIPYLKDLKLDAYYPLNHPSQRKPVLVIIHGAVHGDGTYNKRMPHFIDTACYFARRGMVCFAIDFRVGGDEPHCYGTSKFFRAQRASYVDAKAAIRWIRAHASDYGIDRDRIAACGGSSGAGSSIMLSITDRLDFASDWPGEPILEMNHPYEDPGVQACIPFWGTCFEVKDDEDPPNTILFDFSEYFDKNDKAPFLIFHGTEDKTIPFYHAEQVVMKCAMNGIFYLFYPLEGAPHNAWDYEFGNPPQPLNDWVWDFIDLELGWGR